MAAPFKVGLVQMTAARDAEPNIRMARDLVRQAKAQGADFILTPENTGMMEPNKPVLLQKAKPEAEHPLLPAFAELARETGAWLLLGSIAVKLDATSCANRSFLFDPQGRVAARYDKIHMFDVDLKAGESYRESATFRPGREAVVADLPWGRLGLTICYDLRFAYLYRALAKGGASFITVPAAFTRPTGEAHWHVLLRARAIETGAFIFAPAQCGEHAEGRKTFGHSLIVSPWGEVLADGGLEPGVVTAMIDPAKVEEARGMIPALRHDREFSGPATATVLRAAGE